MQPFTHGYALLIGVGMCRNAVRWWGRRRGRRHGYALLIGAKSESSAGIGVMTSVEEIKTGFGGRASFAYHWQNAGTIAASHSLMSSNRFELRGSQEPEAHFPHLGQLARKA